MIVTRNWLQEFVACDYTPEELSHRLTMAGLEVDAMETLGAGLETVIVARLASVEQHPDADRLTVCQVETGTDTVQVVCGATNHKTGDLVAFAQVGSLLPGDFKIKKSKIRGQVSMGMLCSEKELGLAEDSPGIMILPEGLELGTAAFEALGLMDTRYEIGLTPNRPDCLSVVGVAREVAAMCKTQLQLPKVKISEGGAATSSETSVTIDDAERCPRYAARLIRGIKVGPSPDWMVRRLETAGMRSINNVVDVTNYVMMELGHPLHAFDFNLLRGKRIEVRRAVEGEEFVTLDGQPRKLCVDDLMICDGEGPVAVAGVMGGENSEIQNDTVDVLLESAYFEPTGIRRTAKRMGLHTESSHRFERGADFDMVPTALDRAASLIVETAGGEIAPERIDNCPNPLAPREVKISCVRTNALLGLELTNQQIVAYLASIGLGVVDADSEPLVVKVPLFRPDIEREVDLIEEVARLHGYDHIPVTMPCGETVTHQPPVHLQRVNQLRAALASAGYSEVINYSFVHPEVNDRIGLSDDDPRRSMVKILNPLSEDQSVMRTSLVPSMLETVERNVAYRSRDLRLFEMRPTFQAVEGEEIPVEKMRLCVAMTGRRNPEGWAQGEEVVDFYDAKGLVEQLLATYHITKVAWQTEGLDPFFHPGKSCVICSGKTVLGALGEVHPRVLSRYEIDVPVFLLDLDTEAIFGLAKDFSGFTAPSRFPDVFRDSAFLVDEAVTAGEVLAVMNRAKGKDVEDIVLFDLYRGKGVPEGKKSFAVRVRYRSSERTLTDDEITKIHGKLIKALNAQLEAEIR